METADASFFKVYSFLEEPTPATVEDHRPTRHEDVKPLGDRSHFGEFSASLMHVSLVSRASTIRMSDTDMKTQCGVMGFSAVLYP
ncbi:hypothetical protein [Brevibacterium casei]|uniref:hypothetical protein n=1 Tax=Brevibacterium casei TaxID=33889 RepID=UPI000C7631F1|nr:hypothetical protein [Brevibacterium casei]MCT2207184.1 hypothetical protein [Brevibacterium casei]QPR38049.1 hypothetical protein I6G94_10525 [Brevibacterium casei]